MNPSSLAPDAIVEEAPAPIFPDLGPDLQALIALAITLEPHKASPAPYLSTSLLLFALAMPALSPQADTRLGSQAATDFSAALAQLAGPALDEAWNRYFSLPADAIDVRAPASTRRRPELTDNCREWLAVATRNARQAQRQAQRAAPSVADLLQAMPELPHGRFRDVLGAMGVTVTELYALYEQRVLARVAQPPQPPQQQPSQAPAGAADAAAAAAVADPEPPIFQYLVHDQAGRLDLMQFSQYATAIASFLTSPSTSGPISISIQAPWGAGKSSLMHQVRHLLDPRHAERPDGAQLSARNVFKLLNRTARGHARPRLPVPADAAVQEERWTIWFNAWKYESSEQVWAGLVDAIVDQVSQRLAPQERELFLLRLNLARIDDGKVRQKLYDRVARYWWAGARWIGLAALAAPLALAGWLGLDTLSIAGWTGAGLAATLAGWLGVVRLKVGNEPATFSLAEYVRVPDYGKSVGIVHHIHQDLQRVIAQLPVRVDAAGVELGTAPLVIFIDDLDRCAPNKVASIVEGINTFLAGDQKEFMFVIGMDPQMVTAALEHAHKDVKHYLPAYEQNVPLGWRFMDKFIQLAFTIPPRRALAIDGFVRSLTQRARDDAPGDVAAGTAGAAGAAQSGGSGASGAPGPGAPAGAGAAPDTGAGASAPPALAQAVQAERAAQARQRIASRRITNESEIVGAAMQGIVREFMFSPREIKRILNFVRFVLLLRAGRVAREEAVPPLECYQRWTVLCIRWPDMARWLQWAGNVPVAATPAGMAQDLATQRLYLLEQCAAQAGDPAAWRAAAAAQMGLPADGVSWLADPDLYRFFVNESARAPHVRLSHGAGIGFY